MHPTPTKTPTPTTNLISPFQPLAIVQQMYHESSTQLCPPVTIFIISTLTQYYKPYHKKHNQNHSHNIHSHILTLFDISVDQDISDMTCCPKGSWQHLKEEYKPQGEVVDCEGVPLYHVGEGDRALLIITDIFGFQSGRHRSIADLFASLKYNVFLPEMLDKIFEGVPVPGPAIVQYLTSVDQNVMNSRFEKVQAYMESKGIKQFFAIGFCWGTWQAFRLSAKYDGFIAIAGPHPSLGIEGMFGGKEIDLSNKVRCPAFLLPAGNDPANVKTGGEVIENLIQRFPQSGTVEFPDMAHGWVVRGNMAEEKVARDVKQALDLIKSFFDKFN